MSFLELCLVESCRRRDIYMAFLKQAGLKLISCFIFALQTDGTSVAIL